MDDAGRDAQSRRGSRWGVAAGTVALVVACLIAIGPGAGPIVGASNEGGDRRVVLHDEPGPVPLPDNLRPPLGRAAADGDLLHANGCHQEYAGARLPRCVFGKTTGRIVVALVGDSHAAQWFPAIQRVAIKRGWRLLTFTKTSCRFADLRQYSRVLHREYRECATWRTRVVARLRQVRPAFVIVGVTRGLRPMRAVDGDAHRQGLAVGRLLRQLPGRVVLMVDSPGSLRDVPTCLAAHRADIRVCETRRAIALGSTHVIVERIAATSSGARRLDMARWICPRDPCPVILNRMIIYRDTNHLTATFVASLAARFDASFRRLRW